MHYVCTGTCSCACVQLCAQTWSVWKVKRCEEWVDVNKADWKGLLIAEKGLFIYREKLASEAVVKI